MGTGWEIWAVPQRFGMRCLHPLLSLQLMHMGRAVCGTLFGGQPCVGTGKIALLSLQLLGKERKDAEGQFAFQVPARGNAEHAQLAGTCLRAGWRASKCKYEHWGGIHNKPFSWLPALF